jgi:hypothetical protein
MGGLFFKICLQNAVNALLLQYFLNCEGGWNKPNLKVVQYKKQFYEQPRKIY